MSYDYSCGLGNDPTVSPYDCVVDNVAKTQGVSAAAAASQLASKTRVLTSALKTTLKTLLNEDLTMIPVLAHDAELRASTQQQKDALLAQGPCDWANVQRRAAAKALFQEGQAQYAAGNYLEAIQRFQEASQAYAFPAFIFNTAVCYEKLGEQLYLQGGKVQEALARLNGALNLYQEFAGKATTSSDKSQAQAAIVRLTQRAAEIRTAVAAASSFGPDEGPPVPAKAAPPPLVQPTAETSSTVAAKSQIPWGLVAAGALVLAFLK